MTTLAELRIQCRELIGDNSVTPKFTVSEIDDFINRGIADLNAHFPRRDTYTISTTAGTLTYRLQPQHQQVLSVEYPTGETPPRYLKRSSYQDPGFYSAEDHYDYLPSNDASPLEASRIVLSVNPPTGETITVEFAGEHSALTAADDTTTVPDRLLHLIALFVRWKTWESLASQEGKDPNPLKSLTSIHGLNAERAEASYRAALATAKASYTESAIAPWHFPDHKRIY